MNIENKNGLTIITASDEDKRISNLNMDFFSKLIYLSKNDSVDNYIEVDKSIWENFIDNDVTDLSYIKKIIDEQSSSIILMEEIIIDTDYKLLLLKMEVDNLGTSKASKTPLYSVNQSMTGYIGIHGLLKKRILRKSYTSKGDMNTMLSAYKDANRIDTSQYEELISLLAEQ